MRREGCARQTRKIAELKDALMREGYFTLDAQATVLGLGRSTTWTILRANHKASGLSPSVIIRILSSPQLPPSVRQKLYEYVKDKIAGSYGHKGKQVRRFTAALAVMMQLDLRRAVRQIIVSEANEVSAPRSWTDMGYLRAESGRAFDQRADHSADIDAARSRRARASRLGSRVVP